MLTEDQNYTPIVPQHQRVSEASTRVLEVISSRGNPEQVERLRQTLDQAGTPPLANNPAWPIFAAEAMATVAELVDGLLAEREPKRGRGRPRKAPSEEGEE